MNLQLSLILSQKLGGVEKLFRGVDPNLVISYQEGEGFR